MVSSLFDAARFDGDGAGLSCIGRGKIVSTASGLSFFRIFIPNFGAKSESVTKQSSVKWSLQRLEFAVGPLHSARVRVLASFNDL